MDDAVITCEREFVIFEDGCQHGLEIEILMGMGVCGHGMLFRSTTF